MRCVTGSYVSSWPANVTVGAWILVVVLVVAAASLVLVVVVVVAALTSAPSCLLALLAGNNLFTACASARVRTTIAVVRAPCVSVASASAHHSLNWALRALGTPNQVSISLFLASTIRIFNDRENVFSEGFGGKQNHKKETTPATTPTICIVFRIWDVGAGRPREGASGRGPLKTTAPLFASNRSSSQLSPPHRTARQLVIS